MQIQVMAMDGVFDTGLAAVLDTLAIANELSAKLHAPVPAFVVTVTGPRRKVTTAQGLTMAVQPASAALRADAIVVPALAVKQPEQIEAALAQRDARSVCGALRDASAADVWIGAACTATFVLAHSTLLDGHRATTSWWLAPTFRQRFPRVRLEESRMVVTSAPFVTAGAALAHIDLALGLVRGVSPTLASMTARYLLVEPRASQAAFVIPDHLAHADPLVERFEQWARSHLARGFSLAEAARSVGASERSLSRRLNQALGKSPLSYFQDIRIQHAVNRIETSSDSLERIAASVGYSDGVTLRNLLRTRLGKGVRELRAQAAG